MATASDKAGPMREKELKQKRKSGNLWILGYFLVFAVLFRLTDDLVYWIKCLEAGKVLSLEDAAVGDIGAEAYQGLFLKAAYLLFGIGTSAILAGFMKDRLEPGSFGPLSRWAVLFCVFLLSFCLLGA